MKAIDVMTAEHLIILPQFDLDLILISIMKLLLILIVNLINILINLRFMKNRTNEGHDITYNW